MTIYLEVHFYTTLSPVLFLLKPKRLPDILRTCVSRRLFWTILVFGLSSVLQKIFLINRPNDPLFFLSGHVFRLRSALVWVLSFRSGAAQSPLSLLDGDRHSSSGAPVGDGSRPKVVRLPSVRPLASSGVLT